MKFKTGDRVNFLNDTGGGTVTRIDEKGFVYVITEDGFEIPVPAKELVFAATFSPENRLAVDEESQRQPEKKPDRIRIERKQETIATLPANIPADAQVNTLLGFIPENDGPVFNNTIGCYLINDSPFFIYYMAGKKESGRLQLISSGSLEPDTKTFLKSFDQTALSKISDIHLQILYLSGGNYQRRNPVDVMISLNLVNFSKESYYRENEYFSEKAVLFDILGKNELPEDNWLTEVPHDVREQKMMADRVEKPKPKEPVTDTMEVDLHYEGNENSQLTPSAILALQMSRFHAAIEEAISKNMRRLVVIHGIGQGTLKMQIRKELQEKYPGFVFQDASFKEYGFGATMVHIMINKKQ